MMIIGRCSDTVNSPPAVITATVGTAGSAAILASAPGQLAAFFASPEGRATLSRTGDADEVTMLEILASDDALVLHLTDRAVGEYWRAVLGLRGRLVTLAVTPPAGLPLSPAEGRRLLDRSISAMRAANAA
ncbi:MAG: cation transport ATPase, partial [Tabrizicola sp.]|nr:cation transport ATPase [Tabrizicola sp.]